MTTNSWPAAAWWPSPNPHSGPASIASSASSFADYFRHLTDVEPRRAARYGIDHYSWLCINAKEAENVALSREVIRLIPPLLDHPRVLGIGEIGLNKNTANEITIFEEQVDLAAKYDQLILIHTPHLEDKHKGTAIICDILKNDRRIKPGRVLIDHCEEHTIRMARDAGFWCGLTIYPVSKATPQRGVDILEQFGPDQICVNSASDWGESGPHMLDRHPSRIPPPRTQPAARPSRFSITTHADFSDSAPSGNWQFCPT